jgi:hypothetical protein
MDATLSTVMATAKTTTMLTAAWMRIALSWIRTTLLCSRRAPEFLPQIQSLERRLDVDFSLLRYDQAGREM